MGTATFTLQETDYFGSRKAVMGLLAFSSTYTQGGDTITPGQFGLERIDTITGAGSFANTSGDTVAVSFNKGTTTGFTATGYSIQAFGAGTGGSGITEIAANTNLSAYSGVVQVIGW